MFRELMDEGRLFLLFKAYWYKLNPRWCQRWQTHCNFTTGKMSPQYGVFMLSLAGLNRSLCWKLLNNTSWCLRWQKARILEPQHDKTNKMTNAPS